MSTLETAQEALLHAHLSTGACTLAHAWLLQRADGVVMGFTDHDQDLAFDGMVFRAGTGLSARALEQTTGLAVDNSEAHGALSDLGITELDLQAGRFDGAALTAWQLNWANPEARRVLFRGHLGEITQNEGSFRAELRGIAERLNQPQGRFYQRRCSAVLGDRACKLDLLAEGFAVEAVVERCEDNRILWLRFEEERLAEWFGQGLCHVLEGAAQGMRGVIKFDQPQSDPLLRRVELWQSLRAPLALGERLRVEAGCDKTPDCCRLKFGNFMNFRGFPHMPGEDWLMAYPNAGMVHDGGSLRS